MKEPNQRRDSLPYRLLLVVILGGVLALVVAALSNPAPLSTRTLLLLLAGVLFLVAVALEVVFRDIQKIKK